VRRHAPLVAILCVAAAARYWAIQYCVPIDQCRPDEDAMWTTVYRVFRHRMNPDFLDWPSLFLYAVTLSLVPFFKIGVYRGWFRGEGHFIDLIGYNAGGIIVAARLLSAAAGVVSVWLVYRIAIRLFDRTTALNAALFLALAFLHVRDSHFGVTDVPATMFILASVLFALRLSESGAMKDLLLSAMMAGFAASTKYNAVLVVLAPLWVVLRGSGAKARRAAIVIAVLLAAFLLTTPYSVLDYPKFVSSLQNISSHLAEGHGVMLGRGWFVHLTQSLRYGLGLPLLAAGIVGLVLLLRQRPREAMVIAIFPVTYYLVIGSGFTVFARYILPVVPFLCLTAAYAVAAAGEWIASRAHAPARSALVAWVLAAVAIAPSAWSVLQFDRLLRRADSRVIVSEWIRQRLPEGGTINVAGRFSTRPQFFAPRYGELPIHRVLDVDDPNAPVAPDLLVVATTSVAPHAPGADPSDRARALMAQYRPVYTVDTYDQSATGVVYDWQDEFYLPLTGFGAITRPGPALTIYARPDLAKAKEWR
jgi:Dolichyl-phosphate-mannose-protein mannosyltransferase